MNHLRKLFTVSILSAAVLSAMMPAVVRAFTSGNLAVEQLAVNATSSTFSIVELNPYATNSMPVTSNAIPSTGSSALRQTSAGSAGRLALTQDRTLIAFTGANDGTGVADETSITNRGVGTLDANGKYTLQALYTNSTGTGDQARSGTSLDNKTWFFADKAGIYTNGLTTPLNITNVLNLRCYAGTVYVLSAKAAAVVSTLSTDGKSLTSLPGLPVDANATDFYMIASGNNGNTNDILYVSDGAKVVKYSLVSGVWVNNGTNAVGVTADGLCAINNGSGAYLYVTTGAGGKVVEIADTAGYNTAFTINTNNNVILYAGAAYLKGIDFTPMPNLAVEQLQQNTTSSTFSIVELNPYSTNSSPVNTISIPSTGPSALRQSSAGSTGRLGLSGDRTLLAFAAFQDATGVADETSITARGVGTIDSSASGNYALQASYTNSVGTGDQARSATSLDNKTWYISDKLGIYTNGLSTPANATNVRPLKSFGGTVYALSASSPAVVVNTVSADATTLTGLPGLAVDASALDFYMIASSVNGITNDILYVNDGTTITKYSLVSGFWNANGSAPLGLTADGICAINTGGGANLYVTTGTGGKVVEITDTAGYNSAPTINTNNNIILYAGAPYLKGIDFTPVGVATGGSSLLTPPTLIPAVGATVDAPFTITFTPDNAAWRAAITNITINSAMLSPSAYNTNNPGQIIFTPSADPLLQSSGSKSIVISAIGYSQDPATQPIGAGAATTLAIKTQPASPTGNGGTFVIQPVVTIADQYGNPATNTATFTASVGSGSWSFGTGSGLSQVAVNGTATFTNLSASSAAVVPGAIITFTATGPGLSGLASTTINSSAFNIPAPATAGFTPGNLAVYQVDNSANNSTFSIVELNPNIANQSSPVNIFPITATGSSAMRISNSGSTGRLSDSADGSLLCFGGYLYGNGGDMTYNLENNILNRGAGTLDATGINYVLQASYVGSSGNQVRSATTLDDNTFYMGDKGGIYTNDNYNVVSGTGANVRPLKCFGGKVYTMTQSGSTQPTVLLMNYVNGNSLYPLNGFPVEPLASDFYMVASGQNGVTNDILYYIDGSPTNAIFKFCLSYDPANEDINGQQGWVPAGQSALLINGGILNSGSIPSGGGDGLCAVTNASGGVDLYYTTGSGSTAGNMLIKVHDSAGYNQGISLSGFQTNYIAPANSILKGVAFAPMSPMGVPAAPTVATLTASNITASSATIAASVNPNGAATAYWFQYGTNTSYGSFTSTNNLAAGSVPVMVASQINGLLQGMVYHYQVVATNNAGANFDVDTTFTTLAVTSPQLGSVTLSNGSLHFLFTNAPGASFSVLATNNIAAPKAIWPVIGTAVENPAGSGDYQFIDPSPATNSTLFYILRQP